MKKTFFLLFAVSFCTVCVSQNNLQKIKKQKTISIEQKSFNNICTKISSVIKNYDCNKYLNKKFYMFDENEELVIHIKKNKLKILYKSKNGNGNLNKNFDELIKALDEQ